MCTTWSVATGGDGGEDKTSNTRHVPPSIYRHAIIKGLLIYTYIIYIHIHTNIYKRGTKIHKRGYNM